MSGLIAELERLELEYKNVKGTKCEVWSRVVGYFRPTKDWNEGKIEEYGDRVNFEVDNA